jgi:hypothetical protein
MLQSISLAAESIPAFIRIKKRFKQLSTDPPPPKKKSTNKKRSTRYQKMKAMIASRSHQKYIYTVEYK